MLEIGWHCTVQFAQASLDSKFKFRLELWFRINWIPFQFSELKSPFMHNAAYSFREIKN